MPTTYANIVGAKPTGVTVVIDENISRANFVLRDLPPTTTQQDVIIGLEELYGPDLLEQTVLGIGFDTCSSKESKIVELQLTKPEHKTTILERGITIAGTKYGPYPKSTLVKAFVPNIPLTLNKHQVMEATRHHGMMVRRAFQRRRKEPPRLLLKGWCLQLLPTTGRPSHLNINDKKHKIVYFDEAQEGNAEEDPQNDETPTTQTHTTSSEAPADEEVQSTPLGNDSPPETMEIEPKRQATKRRKDLSVSPEAATKAKKEKPYGLPVDAIITFTNFNNEDEITTFSQNLPMDISLKSAFRDPQSISDNCYAVSLQFITVKDSKQTYNELRQDMHPHFVTYGGRVEFMHGMKSWNKWKDRHHPRGWEIA